MAVKFTNNASATLASSINATVTTIVVSGGQGALFPTLGTGDYFFATLVDSSNNIEVVKVTARSTDTMTVVRGQDGTTGRSYTAGDRFELRPTAAALTAMQAYTPSGGITSTTIADAVAELDTKKAPLASPALTGTPTAPTPDGADNSTKLATTAFVQGKVSALGTMSTQNANNVSISGGAITGTTVNGNTVGSNSVGARTVSTSSPTGGSDGDIWYQV